MKFTNLMYVLNNNCLFNELPPRPKVPVYINGTP